MLNTSFLVIKAQKLKKKVQKINGFPDDYGPIITVQLPYQAASIDTGF